MERRSNPPAGEVGPILDGRYRLRERIGCGGMGVVHRAEHLQIGRVVAVKILRHELAGDRRAVQRFQREAVAAGRIGDPHIVQVLDLGREPGGSPYVVMELVEGRSLRELFAEAAPLPARRAAHLGCQLLAALSAAHARGIVHRDLKPSNVMLVRVDDEPDFVKLLDFGICKFVGDPSMLQLTRAGALVGTPGFMAPEQILAGRDIDHRVDLWSVGALLYLALTGRRPHEGPGRAGEILAAVEEDVPPLRVHRADLEPGLEAVVLRALAREREARYPTAAAFREALSPYGSAPPDFAQRAQGERSTQRGEEQGDGGEKDGGSAGRDGERTPTTPVSRERDAGGTPPRSRGPSAALLAALAALAALGVVGGDVWCRHRGGSGGKRDGTRTGYSEPAVVPSAAPSAESSPVAPSPSAGGGSGGSGVAAGTRGGSPYSSRSFVRSFRRTVSSALAGSPEIRSVSSTAVRPYSPSPGTNSSEPL
ncbi:MAG: serine/threonine protein kinase [Deltaproteobacteria bacterium]|nr:serine/threonine protein kinase [Deltaproteobacteria bacterium]